MSRGSTCVAEWQLIHRHVEVAGLLTLGIGERDQELISPFPAAVAVPGIVTECPVIRPDDRQGADRRAVTFADQRKVDAAHGRA